MSDKFGGTILSSISSFKSCSMARWRLAASLSINFVAMRSSSTARLTLYSSVRMRVSFAPTARSSSSCEIGVDPMTATGCTLEPASIGTAMRSAIDIENSFLMFLSYWRGDAGYGGRRRRHEVRSTTTVIAVASEGLIGIALVVTIAARRIETAALPPVDVIVAVRVTPKRRVDVALVVVRVRHGVDAVVGARVPTVAVVRADVRTRRFHPIGRAVVLQAGAHFVAARTGAPGDAPVDAFARTDVTRVRTIREVRIAVRVALGERDGRERHHGHQRESEEQRSPTRVRHTVSSGDASCRCVVNLSRSLERTACCVRS